jgi:23S rRNA (guanosine2251-2'-O)-methyltransferase
LRQKEGECMAQYIYGRNTVKEKLSGDEVIEEAYILEGLKDDKLSSLLEKKRIKVIKCSRSKLDKIAGNSFHQGVILKVKEYETISLEELLEKNTNNENSLFVILDGVVDPHNVGAILRTSEAIGVNGVIIPKNNSCPLNSTVAKTSTGAIDLVDIAKVSNLTNTIAKLKKEGYWIVGAEASESVDYRQVDYNGKIALVLGSEGKGISRLVLENCDYRVRLPMVGKITSLNVSVATAILLYQVYNNRNPL